MTSTLALTLCLLLFFVFLVWLAEDTQRYIRRSSRTLHGAPAHRVVLESPFRPMGDSEEQRIFSALMNRLYLRLALYDSLSRGEAPFASHAIYTQALDDAVGSERSWGIKSGFAWGECASRFVVYEDLGVTPGMIQGMSFAEGEDIPVERRQMFKDHSQMLAFYDLAATLADDPLQEEPNGRQIHEYLQKYTDHFKDYTTSVETAILDFGNAMDLLDLPTDDETLPEEEAKIALYDQLARHLEEMRQPAATENTAKEKEDSSC
jgi:hypothetical protein